MVVQNIILHSEIKYTMEYVLLNLCLGGNM